LQEKEKLKEKTERAKVKSKNFLSLSITESRTPAPKLTPQTSQTSDKKTGRNIFSSDLTKIFGGIGASDPKKTKKPRGSSLNVEENALKELKPLARKSQASDSSNEKWVNTKYESMDDRIIGFIDFLHNDKENQS
jgi:hypothetical protein